MAYKAMVSEWIGYINLVRSDLSELFYRPDNWRAGNMPCKTRLSYKKNYKHKRQVEYVHVTHDKHCTCIQKDQAVTDVTPTPSDCRRNRRLEDCDMETFSKPLPKCKRRKKRVWALNLLLQYIDYYSTVHWILYNVIHVSLLVSSLIHQQN